MKSYVGLTRAFQGGSPPFPILAVVFRRQLGVVAVFYVSVGTQCSKVVLWSECYEVVCSYQHNCTYLVTVEPLYKGHFELRTPH